MATEVDERRVRRHGAELEGAILDAAWQQLVDEGYDGFTFDAVAARAGTSKPVLYRRWPGRRDLLLAAVEHRGRVEPASAVPDTGSLRGDVLAMLTDVNAHRTGVAAMFSSMLGAHYDDTGLTPAELRQRFLGARRDVMAEVVARAVARGEIDPARTTPRVLAVPFDLYRHEAMMTLRPVPARVLEAIVDEVFLPLVVPAEHGGTPADAVSPVGAVETVSDSRRSRSSTGR